MAYEFILVDKRDRICTITLNRPDALNAVTFGMIDELIEAVDVADRDNDVRVIVLTGSGRCFCAGTDLSRPGGMGAAQEGYKPLQGGTRDSGGTLAIRLYDSMKPVIAAINGPAMGIGASMLLPADIRIASKSARFGFLYVRRGIVPESCASWFLPRIVGISRAVGWAVSGRTIPVEEAHAAGLVQEVVEHDQLMARAYDIAREIATQSSPLSVAFTRQAMWRMLDEPHPMAANRIESLAIAAVMAGPDPKEGVTAFKEKRAPEFQTQVPRDLPAFMPWWTDEPFEKI